MESSTKQAPTSGEHTHDDCVQCLQKRVLQLETELDAAKQDAKDEAFEREQEEQKANRFAHALAQLGVYKVSDDGKPLNEAPCVHCGFPKYKHSSDAYCPNYAYPQAKKFTP